jgi:hypothetical protein
MLDHDEPTIKKEPDYSEDGPDPCDEGREARDAGDDLLDNPYHRLRQEDPHDEWARGDEPRRRVEIKKCAARCNSSRRRKVENAVSYAQASPIRSTTL